MSGTKTYGRCKVQEAQAGRRIQGNAERCSTHAHMAHATLTPVHVAPPRVVCGQPGIPRRVCAGKSALDGNVEARALMEAAGIGGHSDDIRKADAVGGGDACTRQRMSV